MLHADQGTGGGIRTFLAALWSRQAFPSGAFTPFSHRDTMFPASSTAHRCIQAYKHTTPSNPLYADTRTYHQIQNVRTSNLGICSHHQQDPASPGDRVEGDLGATLQSLADSAVAAGHDEMTQSRYTRLLCALFRPLCNRPRGHRGGASCVRQLPIKRCEIHVIYGFAAFRTSTVPTQLLETIDLNACVDSQGTAKASLSPCCHCQAFPRAKPSALVLRLRRPDRRRLVPACSVSA